MKKSIFIIFVFAILFTSCLFDNREEFYPEDTTTPTTVSFSNDVFPIIQSNCVACHGASSPTAGVSLHDYDNIKIHIDNGSLYGSITGTNGYQIMPTTGALPDSEIQTIDTWIQEGALDN